MSGEKALLSTDGKPLDADGLSIQFGEIYAMRHCGHFAACRIGRLSLHHRYRESRGWVRAHFIGDLPCVAGDVLARDLRRVPDDVLSEAAKTITVWARQKALPPSTVREIA